MQRGLGVLAHITSLDGGFSGARKFIDFLAHAKVKYWQILAFNPTGFGDSPYSPLSSFAINPAFANDFKTYDKPTTDAFVKKHKFWLEPFATYMTLKEANDNRDWQNWKITRAEIPSATYETKMAYHIQIQMNLFEQWAQIRKYANDRGIQIIGDIPIYPAMDSADVWANKDLFQFNGDTPIAVAGVAPDYFNADGQLWGNPLYDWKKMSQTKFKWWIERLKHTQELFDVVRIDHFRAFDTYYKIPYGAPNARNGEWVNGIGSKFFDVIKKALPNLNIILEDLGDITQSVKDLRDYTGYPGMRVMQFGFVYGSADEHRPNNYPQNCVAYLGTHDNDAFMGYLKSLTPAERDDLDNYLQSFNLCDRDKTKLAIECLLKSPADTVIIAIQDFLFLGTESRMNTPGTTKGNWKYKIRMGDINDTLADYIKLLVERTGRA